MLDDNNHPYWHTHNYKSWSRNTCCLPSFPIVFLTIWYRFMALFFLMRRLSFSDNLRLKDSINGLGCMFKFDPLISFETTNAPKSHKACEFHQISIVIGNFYSVCNLFCIIISSTVEKPREEITKMVHRGF